MNVNLDYPFCLLAIYAHYYLQAAAVNYGACQFQIASPHPI